MHEKDKAKRQRREKPVDPSKPDTKTESLSLFRQGNTIAQIAEQRKLKPATIESHLTHFISTGELQVGELLDPEKIKLIESAMQEGMALGEVKSHLGESASFGEIRMIMADRKFRTAPGVGEAS